MNDSEFDTYKALCIGDVESRLNAINKRLQDLKGHDRYEEIGELMHEYTALHRTLVDFYVKQARK